jgi:hypothetical protein
MKNEGASLRGQRPKQSRKQSEKYWIASPVARNDDTK